MELYYNSCELERKVKWPVYVFVNDTIISLHNTRFPMSPIMFFMCISDDVR